MPYPKKNLNSKRFEFKQKDRIISHGAKRGMPLVTILYR